MKYRYWLLAALYLALMIPGLLFTQGRSLQEWVRLLVPAGPAQNLLMYPLRHHNPVTFGKLLIAGDIVTNILLFLPIGMIIFLAFRAMFPRHLRLNIVMTVIMSAVASGGIEWLQHLVPKRIPSLSDVAANSVGALVGGLLLARRKSAPPCREPISPPEQLNRPLATVQSVRPEPVEGRELPKDEHTPFDRLRANGTAERLF